ncbi:hypothetical protein CKO39_18155 [Rhodopseudomonas palustris]|nr:hypothetical protein CKO39_18155 [Rhodopseudomonas palustris]
MTRPLNLTPEQRRERRRIIRQRYDNSPLAKLHRKYRRSGFTGFALDQAIRSAQAKGAEQ